MPCAVASTFSKFPLVRSGWNRSLPRTGWTIRLRNPSKKLSPELVNEFYKSAEKFPKDPKWPSTLKVKLPFDKKGAPQFVLYDENKKPIDIVDSDGNVDPNAIPKGCEAVCLIQSTGVWFVGKTQFGVGYKLLQAKIYKSNKLSGYSIVDSEPEDEVEEDVE